MKKIIALALAAVMALSMVACGGEKAPVKYKTGMGIVVSPSLTDATAEKAGKVQMNTTMVVATFDAEGKVVSVSFDVAQQALNVNGDGTTADASKVDLRTKVEKEYDYYMKDASGIGKELFEQVNGMEDWMVGKTIEEIKAAVADGKAVDADLLATATIKLGDYITAITEAWETATETENVAKTGLGQNITVKGTNAGDKNGSVQVNTNIVGVALDAEGKIVWAKIDVAQNSASFDVTGVMQGEVDVRTKVEKGFDYGMGQYAPSGKEYFEHVEALGNWMLGKTVADVQAMETYERDASHTAVPAVEDLKASCTITVDAYLAALGEAAELAK